MIKYHENIMTITGAGGHHTAQNHHVRGVKSCYVLPLSLSFQKRRSNFKGNT